MFGVEMSVVEKLETLNIQFYWVGMHQKMNFLLSSQYNIQHMQPGNAI